MTSNFESSLAVPSTAVAIAELRNLPMHPQRAARFAGLTFGALEDGERFGDAEHRRVAEEIGLVRLGACFETESPRTLKKEVWTTQDGAVYASFSDPARYHLGTYFDDGSCHLTWAHANPRTLTNPGFLVSTGGTGDLRADLAAHVPRVKAALAGGRRFLAIHDLETALELFRHYERQLAPLALLAANDEVRRLNKKGRVPLSSPNLVHFSHE